MAERRMLVVKLADLGDLLTATPATRALRQSFPKAQVDVLVTPHTAPLLQGSPLVDRVITFPKARYDGMLGALNPSAIIGAIRLGLSLRRHHYDRLFIFHHLTTRWGTLKYAALAFSTGAKERVGLDNGRGWFLTNRVKDLGFGARHEVEYWLDVVELVGAKSDDKSMYAPPANPAEAEAYVACDKQYVVIHPGAGGYAPARRWPPERFAQVADELADRYGTGIVLLGGPGEEGVAKRVAEAMRHEVIDLAGRTSLSLLAGVIKGSSLFVGNDSGVMHLAAALGTPVVAIFGPSNPRAWGPWGEGHAVVRADLSCSPCLYVSSKVGRREGCEEMKCLVEITPEMVLEAIERLGVL